MANEFKIKKGLIVTGASGGTVVDIQGSQGQLFSVTDDLSGSIFAVSDISGVPILDVNSSGTVNVDGTLNINNKVVIQTGTTYAQATDYLYVGGNDLSSGDAAIYLGNRGDGTGYGWRFYYSGLGSGNANNLIIRSENLGSPVDAVTFNQDGFATFANKVRAVSWFQGASATNTLYSAGSTGLLLQTAGSTEDNNDSKIFFRNSGMTVKHTFNTHNGDATFVGQGFSAATSSGDGSSTLTTKGYVDSLITGATIYRGAWDPSGGGYGSPDLSGVTQTSGYYYICSAAGTAEPNGTGCEPDSWETGDWVIWNDDIVDCAGTGTGGWQKIDNSSVLSGVGTGQTVALWEGADSVTDSETLGNAPITVSGSDATFAGMITVNGGGIDIDNDDDIRLRFDNASTFKAGLQVATTAGDMIAESAIDDFAIRAQGNMLFSSGGNAETLRLDTSRNATFAGTVSSGRITVSSDAAGDSSWDDSGILIENTSTTTGEPTLAFRNAGTTGTGSNYWFTGLNQSNTYKIAYGTSFTDGNTKLELAVNGALRLNTYTQGFLQTDANGNISTSGGGTLPGGPYLPLSAGSGERVTGDLYIDNNLYMRPSSTYGSGYKVMDVTGTGNAPYPTILSFSNYGKSSVMVLNDEKVGIGTTNPGSKLELFEVSGGAPTLLTLHQYAIDIVADDSMGSFIDFKSTDINANFTPQARIGMLIRDSNGDNGVISEGCGNLVFHTSRGTDAAGAGEDVERMRITDIGNVGIGTSTPSQKLTIRDDSATVYSTGDAGTNTGDFVLQNNNETDNNFNRISFQSNSDNNQTGDLLDAARITAIYPDHVGSNPSGELAFETKPDAGSMAEAMRIDRDGNVGIGTDSPQVRLTLRRESNGSLFEFNRPASGVEALYSGIVGNDPYFYSNNGIFTLGINNPDGGLGGEVSYITMRNGSTRYTTFEAGNVGIGVTNPDAKLEIAGTEEARYLHVDAIAGFAGISSTMAAMVDFENAGDGNNVKITTNNSVRTDAAPFSVWTNTNSRFIIRNNGSVGIGTAAPRDTLEIVGNMRFVEGEDHLMIKPNSNIHGADFIVGDGVAAIDTPVMSLNGLYGGQVTIQTQGNTIADKTVLDVQGTQGQLFSVTDDLSGDIFSVADISGVPIMNVNSSGVSYFDGSLGIGTTSPDGQLDVTDGNSKMVFDGASSDRPLMYFQHNAVPVDGEEVGLFDFRGYNSASQDTRYVIWTAKAEDVTDGTEDGSLQLMTMKAGTATTTFTGRSGKVGIANANPAQALDVTGKIRVTDDIILAQTNGRIDYDNGVSTGALRFFSTSGNTERMRISSAGNLGIGTTGPAAKLHVADNTNFTSGQSSVEVVKLQRINTGGDIKATTEGHVSMWATDSNNNNEWARMSWVNDNANDGGLETEGALSFWTSQAGTLNRAMYIDHDQNVGIGTTEPGAKLTIKGSDSLNAFKITDSGDGDGFKVTSHTTQGTYVQIYDAAHTQTIMLDGRSDSTARHSYFNGGGNFGIGVTVPTVKLHVNQGNVSGTVIKASGIQAQIEIQTSTAGDAHLYMRPNTTGNNAAIFKMTAGTNYNWRWQDDATTPVVFMQLSQSNSSLSVKGDIIAYGSPSDERYKENIKPIESALDKAVKLQGVTFDWKESDSVLDIKEDIGFIAQDVQKVVPELVRENEDGKLSLRYQGVTPILLEAIKELKAEIDLLKSKPCNCNNCNCSI